MTPQANEIYKHFKGNLYKVITIAIHSETEEDMVVYQALYGDYKVYCRPLSSFISDVDTVKYPDATQKKRFELVSSVMPAVASITEPDSHSISEDNSIIDKNTDDNQNSSDIIEDASAECLKDDSEDYNMSAEVAAFLDARTISEKIDIFSTLKNKCTQYDLTVIATIMDIELDRSLDYSERYKQMMNYLKTRNQFETSRLR